MVARSEPPSRAGRWIGLAVLTAFVVLLAMQCRPGVTLAASNKRPNAVESVLVRFDSGSAAFQRLSSGKSASKFVGMLGEGATFRLFVRDTSACTSAVFEVYFRGLTPQSHIDFQLLPGDQALLVQNGQQDEVKTLSVADARSCTP